VSDTDAPTLGTSRRRHTALYGAIAVACVVALLVAVLATRKSAVDRESRSPLLGKLAPTSTVGTDLQGQTVSLLDLRGRYVLVNFFASWCIPCQNEHPQLQQFTAEHKSAGDATVLGVIFDDDVAHAKAFVKDNPASWPIIADPGGLIALDYGVQGPPESFLIDPNGVVVVKFIGQVTQRCLDSLVSGAPKCSSSSA
jgi:cytochrome c biogenesis protein CcmG/thiol:disulfide interchange protein DsbE